MEKISVIGMDGSGKSSIVNCLGEIDGFDTIFLTNFKNADSRAIRRFGAILEKFSYFGEINNLRSFTGFFYLLYLLPHYAELKSKKNSTFLVSDRDPILDTLCYSKVYLPEKISDFVRPLLKNSLESFFDYPNTFIHLRVSPKVAIGRRKKSYQMHERFSELCKLQMQYERELSELRKGGLNIRVVDANKGEEDVREEVLNYISQKYLNSISVS